MSHESGCPDLSTLLSSIRGELPEADLADLERHLESGCQLCQENLGLLRGVERAGHERLESPPSWVVERAQGIPSAGNPGRRIRAEVAEEQQLVGVRSAGTLSKDSRRVWSAPPHEVEVATEFLDANQALVTGQLRPCPPLPVEVTLLRSGQIEKQARADERGHFLLEVSSFENGTRVLVIQLPGGDEIEIPLGS